MVGRRDARRSANRKEGSRHHAWGMGRRVMDRTKRKRRQEAWRAFLERQRERIDGIQEEEHSRILSSLQRNLALSTHGRLKTFLQVREIFKPFEEDNFLSYEPLQVINATSFGTHYWTNSYPHIQRSKNQKSQSKAQGLWGWRRNILQRQQAGLDCLMLLGSSIGLELEYDDVLDGHGDRSAG